MITRERAADYLDRMVEAKKVLDEKLIDGNTRIFACVQEGLLIARADALAEALGKPYIRRSFTENADKVSFHWKGYEVYDIDFNKRIAHIA